MNNLYDHCNEWQKSPYNLLDTPNEDIFYNYPPSSIYYQPPKLPISGELLTPTHSYILFISLKRSDKL